ncbi:MAG TPA: FkbM family methyltransferase [Thermodesulfobacteriota bacterium]|nr:FkbM family methyltransferase [Thermodesulfobacteriota bacterium]
MSLVKNMAAFKNWYMLYAGRYGFLHKEVELIHRNGLRIRLRPNTDDLRIVKSNFVKRNYTKDFVPITRESIVVDVGAHIGSFSIMVARSARRVLAFEPEPTNYQMLKKNVEINHLDNMSIFEMAVSGRSGHQDIYTYQGGSSADYSLYERGTTNVKVGHIPTISVEEIFKREGLPRIDFLKLDCEGAEHDILRNMSLETAAKIMGMAMEAHRVPSEFSIDIPLRLKELGFEIEMNGGGGYIYARRAHPK